MGKRGPTPKPSHLKVVEGTYRKDRAPKNEAKPELVVPDPPEWLDTEAKTEWDRQVTELSTLGLVSNLDRGALVVVCEAWSDFVAAAELVRGSKRIAVTSNGNIIQHPAVGMKNTAAQIYLKACAEFGMTPAARTRVEAVQPEGDKESKWQRFKKSG